MNRTILILGDSVDRNGLEHLAVMLGLPRYSVPYDDYSRKGEVPKGWDGRGVPWVIHAPWLDLTLTNGFLYGLVRLFLFSFSVSRTEQTDTNKPKDDEDNFRQQPDWHPPGLAEERIDKLVKVHTDQLKYPPSFISLHSGRKSPSLPPHQLKVKKIINQINLSMGSSFFRSSRSNQ